MLELRSLRRGLLAVAGATVVAGVAVASSVGVAGASLPLISLHQDTAEVGTDCPTDGAAYWHFVLAPNDGGSSFVTIVLNLATGPGTSEEVYATGDQLVPNGDQTDNVFVAVPEGHELTDLIALGSYATYSGDVPNEFNLSHVCPGEVPTTTEPTTTQPPTTEAPATTVVTPTTAVAPEVLGAVQTAPSAEAAGAVQTGAELPYTGSTTLPLALAGAAVLIGGATLAGVARSRAA